MSFKVEKGFEIGSTKRGPKPKYPWREMEVGDSVLFKYDFVNGTTKEQMSSYAYGKQSGKKFSGRKVDGGMRIWRIK